MPSPARDERDTRLTQTSAYTTDMKAFNILFIFPHPFHPERGGVERVTDVLTKELLNRGHKVFYLHRYGSMEDYGEYASPAPVTFLPNRELHSEENMDFYRHYLRENGIDIIINQLGTICDYCPFTQVTQHQPGLPKSVTVVHTAPLLNYKYLLPGLFHPKKKALLPILRNALRILTFPLYKRRHLRKRVRELNYVAQKSDCLCVLSDGYLKQLELAGLYPDAPCHVQAIPNPCAFPPAEQVPPKKKQILYIGRFEPIHKAPMRLIDIWKRLCNRHPDWELVLVGDGPIRKSMEKRAAKLPRVRFEGFRPPVPYYQDASICCLTSSLEGFPMVLLESMAFGCIPFAYNTFPILGDIFGADSELLSIPPFNADIYAEHLSSVMQDTDKRRQLAELSLQKSREYTIQATTDRWEMLFEELAAK